MSIQPPLSAICAISATMLTLLLCGLVGCMWESSDAGLITAADEASDEGPQGPKRSVPRSRTRGAEDPSTGVPGLPASKRPILDTYFQHYGVSPTIETAETNVSSFALDVETASYNIARAVLERNELPGSPLIRVEEFVNYFDYHYPAPRNADFGLNASIVPSPLRDGFHVLHIGIQARETDATKRSPANLVFVVDASNAMGVGGRLGLVKDSLRMLAQQLNRRDRIAIVAYGASARVTLEPTPGHKLSQIMAAIDQLRASGSPNVDAGLRLAYSLTSRRELRNGNRRVILCSGGVANSGTTPSADLLKSTADHAKRGTTTSTIGVGLGHYNDLVMEQIAERGQGKYAYVDRLREAKRAFVESLGDTLQVVARDAKLQVEFDPKTVSRYRLLGYENRALTNQDFESERPDAGEIGAGEAVTALYELKLRDAQTASLGYLRLRYKAPGASRAALIDRKLTKGMVVDDQNDVPAYTRLALVVAGFAEKLRGSYWAREHGWVDIQNLYAALPLQLRQDPEIDELGQLIDRSGRLDLRDEKIDSELTQARSGFGPLPVLK